MNVEQIFRTREHCKECIDCEKCRLPLADKFGDKGPPQSQDRENREVKPRKPRYFGFSRFALRFRGFTARISRIYLAVIAVLPVLRGYISLSSRSKDCGGPLTNRLKGSQSLYKLKIRAFTAPPPIVKSLILNNFSSEFFRLLCS